MGIVAFAKFSVPYLWLSLAVLVVGFAYWLKQIEPVHRLKLASHPWRNLLAVAISAALFVSPYHVQNEGFVPGILLALLVPLMQGRIAFPFFILGLLTGVNFQFLPVLGLTLVVMMSLPAGANRRSVAILSTLGGIAFGGLLLVGAVSPQAWLELSKYNVQNLNYIGGIYWLIFATTLYLHLSYWRERLSPNETRSLAYLSAIAFGLTFLVCFPAHGQSNAYVLSLPLVMLLVLLNPQGNSKGTVALLVVAFSIAGWRVWSESWAMKPWELLPLFVALVKDTYLSGSPQRLQKAWPLAWTLP